MLILTRKKDEKIIIDGSIEITVIEIRGDQVRLGIKAPKNVTIHRKEILDAIEAENKQAATSQVKVALGELWEKRS